MVSVHLNVHDKESRDRLDRSNDLIDNRPIAAFTEIGHTLDDVFHNPAFLTTETQRH
jgi:hypothetical protein